MSELQKHLETLALRLDRMAMRVAQAVDEALKAIRGRDVDAGERIDRNDAAIDHEEVEIERECINLLALYQPKAVDLRRICCMIKVNNDLERIADIATRIGRRVKYLVSADVTLESYSGYEDLERAARNILALTVRMLNSTDTDMPHKVIEADRDVDVAYGAFARSVLESARHQATDIDTPLTLIILARSLERVGDHCTNIAEDVFFSLTGDIVRHTAAFKYKP